MAEFAGYAGYKVPPVNYGDITRRTLGDLADVETARKKERLDFEDEYANNLAKLGEVEATTNQDMTQFLFQGINQGREVNKGWYDAVKRGEMTMADYKLRQKTLSADWSTMNKFIKNFEKINLDNAELLKQGKMSGFGGYTAQRLAGMGDLNGAKLMVSPEGRVYRASVDDKGEIKSKADLVSVNTLLNPANQADLKVDLIGGIKKFADNIGSYTTDKNLGGGITQKTTSPLLNPAFKKAKEMQINLYTENPRSAASVLTDYIGGYQFYGTEAEKKSLQEKGLTADKLIKVVNKDGIMQPSLTPEQEKLAKDHVSTLIDSSIEMKSDITPGWRPTAGGSGEGKITESEKRRQEDIGVIDKKNEIGSSIFLNPKTSPHVALLVNAAMKSGLDKVEVMPLYPKGLTPEKRSPETRTGIEVSGLEKEYNKEGQLKAKAKKIRHFFRNPQQVSAYIEGAINTGYDAYAKGLIQSGGGAPKVQNQPQIVTLDAVKAKLGQDATQAKIDAYIKQLESTGKYKIQR